MTVLDHRYTTEEFIRLMEVISEDRELRCWFLSLENMPENLRYSQLRGIAEKMKANKVNTDLVEALESLLSSEAFRAAVKTVKDLAR
jgi:hypothetical protein